MDIRVEQVLPKASDAKIYFEKLIEETKGQKIKSIYSRVPSYHFFSDNVREYDLDEEIYVIFENDDCLVIMFIDMDGLSLQYRKMTSEEIDIYEDSKNKDIFNLTTTVYEDNEIDEERLIRLDYDELTEVELRMRSKPYDKWYHHKIEEFDATDETFDMLTFRMKNGNTFVIRPEDAIFDGYQDIWSDDAVELINGHPYTGGYEFGELKDE